MNIDDFKAWAFKEFKINLSAYKETQLNRRILSLMSRSGFSTFEEYTSELKTNKEQRQKFLDFITINVTEFFRNPEIFKDLEKEIGKKLKTSLGEFKVWSAACSIGCEPYSLAIILDKFGAASRSKILATDIDLTILEKAKKGEYGVSEIKNISKEDLNKYFNITNDKYYINDKIKKNVIFKKHDLILEEYDKGFDLIVCRNVVIYFNQDVKEKMYEKFSKALKPGGLFFVGATESIYNYKEFGFEKASTFIYKKI